MAQLPYHAYRQASTCGTDRNKSKRDKEDDYSVWVGGGCEATKSVGFYLSVSIRFSPRSAINYSMFVTYIYTMYRKYTDHIIWCLYK
jgi:hypothetical protein